MAAWKKLITEDDFGGFANPTGVIAGVAANGVATTAMRSDAAPALGPLTRDLAFGTFKGTGAGDPTAAQDIATKAYVDATVAGIRDPKDSVRLVTAANLQAYTRTGNDLDENANGALANIDGVAPAVNDRILVDRGPAGQASHVDCGIYYVVDLGGAGSKWKLRRVADADSSAEMTNGVYVWSSPEGATKGSLGFLLITADAIVLNTTALQFVVVGSQLSVQAGAGLADNGLGVLSVGVDGTTIEINADALRVKALGITDAHIAAANKDGVAGTYSMRTLGVGAQQACAGNDGRLSDTRVPSADIGGPAFNFRAGAVEGQELEVVGFRLKGYATGARPAAPSVGSLIHDTTISRPMVWY